MSASIFYRLDRDGFDGLLLSIAHRQNDSIATTAEARERLPAFSIDSVTAATGSSAPSNLGPVSARLWDLTYVLFVGGTVIRTPPPFQAKSVLLARAAMPGGDKQNFLTVGGVDGVPLMVAFPQVPDILISERSPLGTFGDSADALEQAAEVMIDRVNTLVPAARALALGQRS